MVPPLLNVFLREEFLVLSLEVFYCVYGVCVIRNVYV